MSNIVIRNPICIVIRNEGERGAFFIRYGKNAGNDYHFAELAVNSTLGNCGQYWIALGKTAPMFFEEADVGYILMKLFSREYTVFDAPATYRDLVRELLQDRRENELSKYDARQIYDALRDLDCIDNETDFFQQFSEYPELTSWREPHEVEARRKINPTVARFGELLWKPFVHELNQEALRPRDITP